MVYGLDSLCLPLDSLHMPASLLLDLLVAAVEQYDLPSDLPGPHPGGLRPRSTHGFTAAVC